MILFTRTITYSLIILLCAISFILGHYTKRLEIKVPLREGDRVIVKESFFAGNLGSLKDRRVMYDRSIEYTIKWDNPQCEGGSFREDEIILIGGWNSVDPSKD